VQRSCGGQEAAAAFGTTANVGGFRHLGTHTTAGARTTTDASAGGIVNGSDFGFEHVDGSISPTAGKAAPEGVHAVGTRERGQ
jgi:hypothetical protein